MILVQSNAVYIRGINWVITSWTHSTYIRISSLICFYNIETVSTIYYIHPDATISIFSFNFETEQTYRQIFLRNLRSFVRTSIYNFSFEEFFVMLYVKEVVTQFITYYIKWVKTFWTYSRIFLLK